MDFELLSTSIVVIAQDHNPSILHPAFLTSQGIVPPEWELASDPVCTPAFSIAAFTNGITFNVENNRFVVTEEKANGNPYESHIADLVMSYVKTLPHVRYKATGVNFTGFCLCAEPKQFLITRFLRAGAWNSDSLPMKAFGSRFLYEIDGAALRFELDAGEVKLENESASAVIVNGNIHQEIYDNPLDKLEEILNGWSDLRDQFITIAEEIIGTQE